jgi:hypothetical protein
VIRRIRQYPVTKFNAVQEVILPKDSYLLAVQAIFDRPTLLAAVPVNPERDDKSKIITEPARVLVVNQEEAWSDTVDDESILTYLGTAICDNGYRIYHVFEVEEIPIVLDSAGPLVDAPVVDAIISATE